MRETNRAIHSSILALLPILVWNKVIFNDFGNFIYRWWVSCHKVCITD